MSRRQPRRLVGFVLVGYLFSVTGAGSFHTHGIPPEGGHTFQGNCSGHCGEGGPEGQLGYDEGPGLLALCPTVGSASVHGPCPVCHFLAQKVLPLYLHAIGACELLHTAATPCVAPSWSIGPARTNHSRAPPSHI